MNLKIPYAKRILILVVSLVLLSATAFAEEVNKIDTGDTAFVFLCAALVMFMLPGLYLLYAGMVRSKNVLNIIMQSFIVLAIVSVQWVLFGYTLAFGPDIGGVIGSLKWMGLHGVGLLINPDYAATIPHQAFIIFQMMFAIITVALISGSVAERMRFSAFFIFACLWTTLIYDPLAHWVWGSGGWLAKLGVLDFSGGFAVEICSGVAGLVMCLVIGKRKGYGKVAFLPHNLVLTVLGVGILWFGWFGFNAGSALSANATAVNAFLTTNTAAGMATLSWVLIEWVVQKKPTLLGAASGSLAGLVAITPACGYVEPLGSLAIGAVAGVISYYGIAALKKKLKYDDTLDVFGIHGLSGTWGCIAIGLFATTKVNPKGADGLFYGNADQLFIQLTGVIATYIFVGVGTYLLLKLVGLFTSLRVSEEQEDDGMDISELGENAYNDTEGGMIGTLVSKK